ncbi:MAG: glycosyltransferase, partial [Fibrobacter sp.]|nr:glycosyltransferase [Fibrobacter sp.]
QGIARAMGEFVSFLDDDDVWTPDKLQKQFALYEKHPGSVIFCGRTFKKTSGENVQSLTVIPPKKFSGDLSRLIRTTYVTSTSCLFFPRYLLEQVGNFDERLTFWQEYELCIRLAQVAEFYFVAEPLVVCLDDVGGSPRVSNRVLNWKENTTYIRNKHKDLYRDLTFMENWAYHATLMKDAFRRHQRAGKKLQTLYYGFLRLVVEYIPSRILHLF